MANPASPVDGGSYRLGYIMKKVSTTLTACLTRAYANATTSGATDVAHIGIATHVEDDAAAISDASNAKPLVLIGGQRGGHVTVSATGDASAAQINALGAIETGVASRSRESTILTSAARTATPTKVAQTNYGSRGVIVVIDVTAIAATPSVVFTIQGYSTLGDDYYTILASAAVTGTGQTVLRVYPGLTAAANLVASDVLPPVWAVDAVHGDADSITYSVNALYIP